MQTPVPVPNLNGNRLDDLLDSHCECLRALSVAADSLACGDSFNGRNFQTHPDPNAYTAARKALDNRRDSLRRIIAEVQAMAEAIADGQPFAALD